MSSKMHYTMVAPKESTTYALQATAQKVFTFNVPCGSGTMALDSLEFWQNGYCTTAGTGNTQWGGAMLGSNAIVAQLEIKINEKTVFTMPDWNYYVDALINLTAPYGVYIDGDAAGKFNEYYVAQTISTSAGRWFKANIAVNPLSMTKHVIDLSQFSSFQILITIADFGTALYNINGDPRYTISDMFVSYRNDKRPTVNAGDIITFLDVSETKVTSATLINAPMPQSCDYAKRAIVCINGAEANMTTNTRFTSDASKLTKTLYFQLVGSQRWPENGIDCTTYGTILPWFYARDSYHQSNPHYFSGDGISYVNFITASTDGYLAFNFSGSDGVREASTASYELSGVKMNTSSLLHMEQSSVTIAGYTRIFIEALGQYQLGSTQSPTFIGLRSAV